jgi:hypothetical protein
MDGQTDRRVGEWTDGQSDGHDRQTDRRTNGRTDGWTGRQADWQMDGVGSARMAEMNRIRLVLFDMNNRTFGAYLTARARLQQFRRCHAVEPLPQGPAIQAWHSLAAIAMWFCQWQALCQCHAGCRLLCHLPKTKQN